MHLLKLSHLAEDSRKRLFTYSTLLIQVLKEEIHSSHEIFPIMEKEFVLSLNPEIVNALFVLTFERLSTALLIEKLQYESRY